MPVAEQAWTQAVALLTDATDVALACHIDPDGDAIGSMLAMPRLLRRRGVRAVASWGDAGQRHEPMIVPPQYAFLPGLDQLTPADGFPQRPELLVCFDTGSPDRLGTLRGAAAAAGTVIVIDHHASGEAFGDVRLCDGQAAATAVVVEELIRRMGCELDREMAICLYVGLVTDTGRFAYPSTTPAVMELGARLIAHDIDHPGINRQVFHAHSFGYLKLLGRAMERATLVPERSLAWTAVHQRDLDELGVALPETEGLIDVLRGVEVAQCALVCTEQPDGRWK
ncbi:MAG: DHH family phosphoesterase, partial [Egibacteraceae bacterium]